MTYLVMQDSGRKVKSMGNISVNVHEMTSGRWPTREVTRKDHVLWLTRALRADRKYSATD